MAHLNGIPVRVEAVATPPARHGRGRAGTRRSLDARLVPRLRPTAARYEAVLFDALGTLVELEPPWPLLRAALRRAHGIEIDEEQARQAMLAEMAYYRAHHMEGRDDASLADLRARCAAVLREQLPPAAAPADGRARRRR